MLLPKDEQMNCLRAMLMQQCRQAGTEAAQAQSPGSVTLMSVPLLEEGSWPAVALLSTVMSP